MSYSISFKNNIKRILFKQSRMLMLVQSSQHVFVPRFSVFSRINLKAQATLMCLKWLLCNVNQQCFFGQFFTIRNWGTRKNQNDTAFWTDSFAWSCEHQQHFFPYYFSTNILIFFPITIYLFEPIELKV